jgi:hypothetical protein
MWCFNLLLNLIDHQWFKAMITFNLAQLCWILYQQEKRVRELREMLSHLSEVLLETIEGKLKWQKQTNKKGKTHARA